MTSAEIRKRFLDFFAHRDHTIVPSSSLIPDDPSVLLTTAGMQQFKPYYTGEADPIRDFGSKNTASVQKSFRTSDIDSVGDETHLTFFEMLGNFSFGGYFKKEAIAYAHEFITRDLGLAISYVSVFKGSDTIPKDEESRRIWNSLGVTDVREEGMEDVFWGPTGSAGPCGPTTEIYCKNALGQDVEIWNIVFNEFFYPGSRDELLASAAGKKLEKLPTPGVDTGMGLERLVMIAQNTKTILDTDLFIPFLALLPPGFMEEKEKRITIDHLRGASFLLADGVRPSNKGSGYILRRLLRRIFVYEQKYFVPSRIIDSIVHDIVHEYGQFYPELLKSGDLVRLEFERERNGFGKTLKAGLAELKKRYPGPQVQEITRGKPLTEFVVGERVGAEAFDLYQTYGLPIDSIKEHLKPWYEFDEKEFDKKISEEFKKHQEISRAGREKKFGGHGLLLDTGELKAADEAELQKVTRLHTATHLLNAALRKTFPGSEIRQEGSDITAERTRFDFSFPRKLTPEEIAALERCVNEAIGLDYEMRHEEMPYHDAVASGALHFFKEKYPATVSVYTVWDPKTGEVFSRELCGGPHVPHTRDIGHFKIVKEESSSAGVRRIRAVVEP